MPLTIPNQLIKQIRWDSIFETSTRFTTGALGTAAAATFGASGVTLTKGTTTTGRSFCYSQGSWNNLAVLDHNPEFMVVADFQVTAANSWDCYFTLGGVLVCGSSGSINSDGQIYFGWHVKNNNGSAEIYTCVNNASTATETLVSMPAGTVADVTTFYCKLTSGTKAEFYINGTLVDTQTSNLPTSPSGPLPFAAGILGSAGTTADLIQVFQATTAFDN